jgi:hypothetical protein
LRKSTRFKLRCGRGSKSRRKPIISLGAFHANRQKAFFSELGRRQKLRKLRSAEKVSAPNRLAAALLHYSNDNSVIFPFSTRLDSTPSEDGFYDSTSTALLPNIEKLFQLRSDTKARFHARIRNQKWNAQLARRLASFP